MVAGRRAHAAVRLLLFQFYPEMLGALALAAAFRWLLFVPRLKDAWWLGLGLATLPWLHQKFLPVWGVLALMGRRAAGER